MKIEIFFYLFDKKPRAKYGKNKLRLSQLKIELKTFEIKNKKFKKLLTKNKGVYNSKNVNKLSTKIVLTENISTRFEWVKVKNYYIENK